MFMKSLNIQLYQLNVEKVKTLILLRQIFIYVHCCGVASDIYAPLFKERSHSKKELFFKVVGVKVHYGISGGYIFLRLLSFNKLGIEDTVFQFSIGIVCPVRLSWCWELVALMMGVAAFSGMLLQLILSLP